MKKECVLIRHGKTNGNMEHRYIGCRTDESLCEEGRKELMEARSSFEPFIVNTVYVSSLLRCKETASILLPSAKQTTVVDLREMDFGDFENKNYVELAENPDYQAWIDSNGTLPFPNGESREAFTARSWNAFRRIVLSANEEMSAFVIHGGSIMAIMSSLTDEDYYSFQIGCGNGYYLRFEIEGEEIKLISYELLLKEAKK